MNKWFKKLNKKQREKTAGMILDICKALILAILLGLLLPDITKRLGLTETVMAVILSLYLYRFAMSLYKK